MNDETARRIVRETYSKIAKKDCCCDTPYLSTQEISSMGDASRRIGYSQQEIESVPEGVNLGLGCGNPVALASLEEGQTVLDLGSGSGLDCFLAARNVGNSGHVIGVDMTPEMVWRARQATKRSEYRNIEFRLGEIENLPVADGTVDVVFSNCVINLSTNKKRVFEEAYRVLRPGGRLIVSDIVLLEKLSEAISNDKRAFVGCLSGAILKEDFLDAIKIAGFHKARIVEEKHFPIRYLRDIPLLKESGVVSDSALESEQIIASITVLSER